MHYNVLQVMTFNLRYLHIWGLQPHYVRPLGMGRYRASWRGGTFFKKSSLVSISASYSEGHLALCSEGHFWRILFGRTLFEDCVRKDTFWALCLEGHIALCSEGQISKYEKKYFLNKLSPYLLTLKWSEYLRHVKRNP